MLGPFNGAMATALRVKLRRPRTSDGTVVLQTPGLAAAIADPAAFSRLDEQAYWSSREQRSRTWIDRINGCLVLAAPPAVLRAWGMALCTIGEHFWDGSDYTELDWPASTGEVQVFPDSPSVFAEQRLSERGCIRAEATTSSSRSSARRSG